MEKIEIVKRFLEMKTQLTPAALEIIYSNQEILPEIEEKVKRENILLVDENLVDKILGRKKKKIEVIVPQPKKEFTMKDVLDYLKRRFEILSSIIQKNNRLENLVSISKLEKSKLDTSLATIGMVKDKTNYSITLEDFSGAITLGMESLETEKLFIDDVIGIEVKRNEGKLKGGKIYFPSLSFFRKIGSKKVEIKNNFIEIDDEKVEVPEGRIARIVFNDSFAVVIDYSVIKPYQIGDRSAIETVISLLERRHLNPSFFLSKEVYDEDPFLLDKIPDAIIVKNSNISEKKVYKGVEIITLL